MNEFLEQFLLESRELADQATRELLALETSPGDKERLDGAFRAFHTLKGCAGIVDFPAMSRVTHAAEEALSAVRTGNASISTMLIGDCLNVVDQTLQWLDEIEASGELPQAADPAADAAVARFLRPSEAAPNDGVAAGGPLAGLTETARGLWEQQLLLIGEGDPVGRVGRVASAGRVAANALRRLSRPAEAEDIERAAAAFLVDEDARPLTEAIARLLETSPAPAAPKVAANVRAEGPARSFRVEAERVDALVALTGELIVAKNAIAHLAKTASETGNSLALALNEERLRLERLVGGLKDTALNLRVMPLRAVFERFQRIVRELALELGKPTTLAVQGEDTEADKAIVETLFEPLLHIVRNALDHGVEPAAARAAARKPATATLSLSARREGEHVVIDIEDDGGGVDAARVRALAAERNLMEAAALAEASEQDILDLIFVPGFSTRSAVSDLSGRGVGMDAVRTAVERMGGRVSVTSALGVGTRFRLMLPFSLMVTKVVTVGTRGQMFGVPIEAVVETLRVPRERVRPIGAIEAFVWRDRAIPLLDLGHILGSERTRRAGADILVLVASVGGQLGAVEVDRLGEEMEVILKPIEGLLRGTKGVAGATLLGDGQVLLVLDLHELFV